MSWSAQDASRRRFVSMTTEHQRSNVVPLQAVRPRPHRRLRAVLAVVGVAVATAIIAATLGAVSLARNDERAPATITSRPAAGIVGRFSQPRSSS